DRRPNPRNRQVHLAETMYDEEAYIGKRDREDDLPIRVTRQRTRENATKDILVVEMDMRDAMPPLVPVHPVIPTRARRREKVQIPLTAGALEPYYSVTEDLQTVKANITFAQLFQAAPQIRRDLQSKLSVRRPRPVQPVQGLLADQNVQDGPIKSQLGSELTTLQIPIEVN